LAQKTSIVSICAGPIIYGLYEAPSVMSMPLQFVCKGRDPTNIHSSEDHMHGAAIYQLSVE
jgi:hypothetical protein